MGTVAFLAICNGPAGFSAMVVGAILIDRDDNGPVAVLHLVVVRISSHSPPSSACPNLFQGLIIFVLSIIACFGLKGGDDGIGGAACVAGIYLIFWLMCMILLVAEGYSRHILQRQIWERSPKGGGGKHGGTGTTPGSGNFGTYTAMLTFDIIGM